MTILPNSQIFSRLFPSEWHTGRFYIKNRCKLTPWQTMGYFILFIPKLLYTTYKLFRLYGTIKRYLLSTLLTDASFKERTTVQYMCFFATLQWNIIEHQKICVQWTPTHFILVEKMYRIYTEIITLDDAIDTTTSYDSKLLQKKFQDFKKSIWGTDSHQVQCILPSTTKHRFCTILEQARLAFQHEEWVKEQNQSHYFWQSLRVQAFVLSDFTVQITSLYTTRPVPSEHHIVFGYIMFMGNIADDWMDYLWSREDIDQPCYIQSRLNSCPNPSTYQLLKVVFHMFIKICLELGRYQIQLRGNTVYESILPSIALLSVYTGCSNLIAFFQFIRTRNGIH